MTGEEKKRFEGAGEGKSQENRNTLMWCMCQTILSYVHLGTPLGPIGINEVTGQHAKADVERHLWGVLISLHHPPAVKSTWKLVFSCETSNQ